MAGVHGRHTVITVDGNDISPYADASEFNPTVDTHDRTGYGAESHKFSVGLKNGTFTCSGTYDNDVDEGPAAVLKPLMDVPEEVMVTRQIEGTGTGKPQENFPAICTSYTESAPVADMVKWSAEFQISDDVQYAAQS